MRTIVGIDHGQIQCPFCKGLKNCWVPVLPLRECPDPKAIRNELELYVTFFDQLIQTQLNNKDSFYAEEKGVPKEIMLVDFENEPVKYVNHIMNATTHLMLSLSAVRSNLLFNVYDPSVQADDICLRDLLLIIISTRRLVTAQGKVSLKQVSDTLLGIIQAD